MCVNGIEKESNCDTNAKFVKELEAKAENGLVCSVDYISFTVLNRDYNFETAIKEFGFDVSEFENCNKGGLGYSNMFKQSGGNVTVYCNGTETMGIHFDISSSGIASFVEHFKKVSVEETVNLENCIFQRVFERITAIGKVTRLDLAIDNIHDLYYEVSELAEILKCKERYVSKFRTGYETKSFTDNGYTVYMGKRESDVMLRVYDKQAEQNNKSKKEIVEYPWVRWELEIKGKKAKKLCEHIAEGRSIVELSLGILSNYLRIIVPDDENKSRCTTDVKWEKFLNNMEKISLCIPCSKKTLDEKMMWFSRQYGSILAAYIFTQYGDMSCIYDNLDGWLCKAKPELRSLIVEEMGRENALRQFSNKFQHIDLCKVLKNVHALEDYVSDDEESTEIIENTLIENDVPQIPEIQHVLTRKLNECLKVLKIDKFFAVTRLLSGKATPEERIEFIDEIIHDKEKREKWLSMIREYNGAS